MNRLEYTLSKRQMYPQKWEILTWPPFWVLLPNQCEIHSNVFFSQHGFGFEWNGEQWLRIPHTGNVIIENNVEIYSGTNIVRPTEKDSRIGEGTKIDALCHIAHNVNIGKHCLIIAGSKIGGSVTIGDNCYLGIGCMIKNKVTIGNNVTIGMGAVITKDVPDNVIIYNKTKWITKQK